MKRTALSMLGVLLLTLGTATAQQSIKYAFVDADCKPGFEVAPDISQKRVLTSIKTFDFEDPAQALFAEDQVKAHFKSIIEELYPASLNQFKGVYVYMLNSPEDATAKREKLLADYREQEILLIDLEL